MSDPLVYFLAVLTLLGVPGPTNTLLAIAGAGAGFVRSLPLIGVEVLAYGISTALVGLFIAPAIVDLDWVAVGLKVLVAAYLVWLAVLLWQRGMTIGAGDTIVGVREVFTATLLNPKALALALGIVPWANAQVGWYLAVLGLVIAGTGTVWIALGAALRATKPDAHLLPRIGAVALTGFAGLLVASVFG
jgi:threonine/homoserine/homoserine lactone efflux protein